MQVKTSKKEKCRSNVSECLEDDGVDYEEELKKSNKLEMELRKEKELVCIEYHKLRGKSVCLDVRYDLLVEQLKNISVLFIRIKRKHV